MTKCPYCFLGLSPDERTFACTSGRCEPEMNKGQSEMLGRTVQGPPTTTIKRPAEDKRWKPPASTQHRACGAQMVPACPYCHFVLPDRYYDSVSVCIAVAGARATGKSVFIGVTKRLLQQSITRAGSTVAFANTSSRQRYEEHYEAPLFKNGVRMPATGGIADEGAYQTEPLILSLGNLNGKLTYLSIRDIAGEDLEANAETKIFTFFQLADLVIYLYDPLNLPAVRDALRGLIPPQDLGSDADPGDVLATVLSRIGQGDPLVAVVMSKFDVFQYLEEHTDHEFGKMVLNRGAGLLRSSPTPHASADHLALINQETRSLLIKLGAQGIVTAMENPMRGKAFKHRFFVNSALGAPTEGASLPAGGIAPYRCDDPIQWALREAGVLGRQ